MQALSSGVTIMFKSSVVLLSCLVTASVAFGDVLIDDHFDNGDPESGGVNGGFVEVGNNQDADIVVTESGTIVTIDMASVQNNPNKGIVSIEPFDATSIPGFQATFVVAEIEDNRCCNGHFLGISDDNVTFFRSIKNFGMAFFGRDDRTGSGEGFGLVVNDIGNPGAETIIATDLIDLDSYLDGFTASFSAGPDGWSYSVADVIDFDGNSDPLEASGSWEDAGLDASFYDDFFDEEEYVFVSAQIQNGEHFQSYDRITVETLGGNGNGSPPLQAGDADMDCDFDQIDLVQVQVAAKYLTGEAATWGEGDWDGAPGGSVADKIPPPGNGQFDQLDIIAALAAGTYLQGSYCAEGAAAALAIPEPSTLLLLAFGLTGMLVGWRRTR